MTKSITMGVDIQTEVVKCYEKFSNNNPANYSVTQSEDFMEVKN